MGGINREEKSKKDWRLPREASSQQFRGNEISIVKNNERKRMGTPTSSRNKLPAIYQGILLHMINEKGGGKRKEAAS